jgi:hypothetical protein
MILSEQEHAKILIEARRKGHNWKNPGQRLKNSVLRSLLVAGLTLTAYASMKQWFAFYVFLAFFVGVLLSQIAFLISSFNAFPFLSKVLNWEKVERAAAGEAID